MIKLRTSFLDSLQKELKEVGVKNICIPEEGKLTVSCRVGKGVVSYLFEEANVGKVEVYDPESCFKGERVYYVSLVKALRLILNKE